MKNPHGVEPTRFMKRKGERCAIECDPDCGPCFGTSIYILVNSVMIGQIVGLRTIYMMIMTFILSIGVHYL